MFVSGFELGSANLFILAESIYWLGYGLGEPGFESRGQQEIFRFFKRSHRLWGQHSLLFKGYRCCFPGARRPRSEGGKPSPSSAVVKKDWSHASDSLYSFMVWEKKTLPLPIMPSWLNFIFGFLSKSYYGWGYQGDGCQNYCLLEHDAVLFDDTYQWFKKKQTLSAPFHPK